jgi:hypothetical protein
MSFVKKYTKKSLLFVLCILSINVYAQKTERKGEFYFSWGYNKDYYTNTNVTISQPSLGNNFTFKNTQLVDHPGWDEALLSLELSIPQYNYRIGYFIDKEKDLAFEINFDHTKALFKNAAAGGMSPGFSTKRRRSETIAEGTITAEYSASCSSVLFSKDLFTKKGAFNSCPVKVMESIPHKRDTQSTSIPASLNRKS